MQTGFLHLHTTVDILFLLWYGTKVILLLTGNPNLEKLRKLKWVDAVLGTLILITGGYLLFNYGHPPVWLMVKVGLVLAMIPLGIIALNRSNKALAAAVLAGYLYIYGVAETRSLKFSKPTAASGQAIYAANCVRCHGDKGDAMKFGAKNLMVSQVNAEDAYTIIRKGKGAMPPIDHRYSDEEVKLVADYILTLRK